MTGLTAVSLFAGIGGIDLALERAGISVVAAVEIDPACRRILARHFPLTQLFKDVTEVTGDQLVAAGFDPRNGIVAAGWPCQDNSVAGRRQGMAGTRSSLWTHVVRLLAETRAAWFLGENVPGLLSVNRGQDFAQCLLDLAGVGMGFGWRVLDAQYFGVPQRRQRVFIVGRAGDTRCAAPIRILFEPESRNGDIAPLSAQGAGAAVAAPGSADVAFALRRDPGGTGQGHNTTYVPVKEINGGAYAVDSGKPGDPMYTLQSGKQHALTLTAHAHKGDETRQTYVTHSLTSAGADASEDGSGRGTPIVIAAPLTAGTTATPSVSPPGRRKEDDTNLVAFANQHRFETSDVAQTLSGSHGQPGGIAADLMVRRLTPLECERLQGFPDGWTAGQSDAARYRQLGNAVAVPVSEWIARRIAATAGAP